MTNGPSISALAALIGDPARANMLTSLMSGQALTANELAQVARITAATASGHLAQLLAGNLLAVEKQGRYRYYRLFGADVATAIEALMDVAQHPPPNRTRPGPKDIEMRKARVCYDHLAGECGVELFTRLPTGKMIELQDGAIGMTAHGEREFNAFGVDVAALKAAKRPICKACLDWSERRSHLAGSLGAALLQRLFELHWVCRIPQTRVLRFTPTGEAAFANLFVQSAGLRRGT